jgi:chromosome segregation ATPase
MAPSEASKSSTFIPSSRSGRPSLINILLLYSSLMGLGAIGGYATFYTIFSTKCSDLMDEVERRHNETSEEVQNKYLTAVENHHRCIEDETRKLELVELKGRLDGQATLVGRHHDLLDKHQESVEKVSSLQAAHDETKGKFEGLQAEVEAKQAELVLVKQEIGNYNAEMAGVERRLSDQRSLSSNIMKKKVEEIELLKTERVECLESRRMMEFDMENMKGNIQRRQETLCREKYVIYPGYFAICLSNSYSH